MKFQQSAISRPALTLDTKRKSLTNPSLFCSIPLWIFAITCIVLGFHGIIVSGLRNKYIFWVSFLPAILILLVGTKLHRIVVKLAVEVVDSSHWTGFEQFNPRDELFWFGNPRLLLLLIQFISFQNAFEMATYIWSMWEIKDSSCFIGDRTFLITRLTFGIVSQFWCSFITFPLYVIVAQMGSKFKKTIVSENVRKSLHGWRRKVKTRHGGQPFRMLTMPSPVVNEGDENLESVSSTKGGRSTRFEGRFTPNQNLSLGQSEPNEVSSFNEKLQDQVCSAPQDEYSDERYDQEIKPSDDIDDHPVLPSKEQLN
ncbi:UNVERIFIED_CONTAM: MLO-like protein 4 [Sesamum angustifolium]|uniref:MLO-like protein 4 n=1 Tax=Sesamum angustifolium TaxID=2727405 RepID=A0AAW2QAV1_9LAMI